MKNRTLLALVLLLALAAIVAHYVLAADPQPQGARDTAAKTGETKAPGKDVKCPVSGKPVNPADFVEFEKAKRAAQGGCLPVYRQEIESGDGHRRGRGEGRFLLRSVQGEGGKGRRGRPCCLGIQGHVERIQTDQGR